MNKIDENNLTTWPDKKLKTRAIGLFSAIYNNDCFSSGDLQDYEAIKSELESRGYAFSETRMLKISKG
jgi:hypothetical protein